MQLLLLTHEGVQHYSYHGEEKTTLETEIILVSEKK